MNSPFPIAQNFAYLLCAIMAAGFLCVVLLWLAPWAHRVYRGRRREEVDSPRAPQDSATKVVSWKEFSESAALRFEHSTAEPLCIDCGERAEAEPLSTQGHEAWRALICRACGCQWVQVFHIARLETIESEVIDPREIELRRKRALQASIAKALKHTQKI